MKLAYASILSDPRSLCVYYDPYAHTQTSHFCSQRDLHTHFQTQTLIKEERKKERKKER